jgi:hypothetical protein
VAVDSHKPASASEAFADAAAAHCSWRCLDGSLSSPDCKQTVVGSSLLLLKQRMPLGVLLRRVGLDLAPEAADSEKWHERYAFANFLWMKRSRDGLTVPPRMELCELREVVEDYRGDYLQLLTDDELIILFEIISSLRGFLTRSRFVRLMVVWLRDDATDCTVDDHLTDGSTPPPPGHVRSFCLFCSTLNLAVRIQTCPCVLSCFVALEPPSTTMSLGAWLRHLARILKGSPEAASFW